MNSEAKLKLSGQSSGLEHLVFQVLRVHVASPDWYRSLPDSWQHSWA